MTPTPSPSWEPLPAWERRVLGVLVEKQKTSKTADSYPLTLNSLTLGCNQKSNRDPVLDLTEDDVEELVNSLQKKGLVMRMTGNRVDRFRHLLYESWQATKLELAVLAELLLRGPQTKGDLRGRANRMDPVDTLDALEEILRPLVARKLVIYLTAPDRRGAVLTHGFHSKEELVRHTAIAANTPSREVDEAPPRPAPIVSATPIAAPVADSTARLESKLSEALVEIAKLRAAVTVLEGQVGELRRELGLAPPTPAP